MPKKPRVEYSQQAEPSFIKQFKKRAGIVPDPTIESKRSLPLDVEDGDRADEQPQLVWSASSGVSEAEARAFLEQRTLTDPIKQTGNVEKLDDKDQNKEVCDRPARRPGKILFIPREERTESQSFDNRSQGSTRSRILREEFGRDRSPELSRPSARAKQGFLSFDMNDEDS